jgi:methionine sulfoxide reductase heme-binding subunit
MTSALWYLGRGFGVSALVLFTLVMVLGIVVRSGRPLPGLPRFAVSTIHRTISLTALGMLALHVGTLYFDPYAQLRLVDLVVPFQGAYRPLWLGLGTLAADLVLVLIGSSLLRQHIGRRIWRVLHWAAYACWPFAMLHAIGNGTDGSSGWLIGIATGCAALVGGALTWRFAVEPAESREAIAARPAAPAPPDLTGVRQ